MKRSFCFFLLVTTSLFCFGQDESEAKKKLQDIDFLAGEWKVNVEARLSAKGAWDTSQGRSVIIKTVRSTVLEEDFTGTRQNKSFVTKSLLAVNNLTLKYQRIFVDSEHGSLIDFEGEKNSNKLIFDKEWVYPDKSKVKLRVVYNIISPDQFIVESMRMPANDTSWDITGRMKYTRGK